MRQDDGPSYLLDVRSQRNARPVPEATLSSTNPMKEFAWTPRLAV